MTTLREMVATRGRRRYGFRMDPLDVAGAWVFTPSIHADRRGSFLEWFRNAAVHTDLGRDLEVAQANCSVSHRGAIRGIHFSDVPPGQAKYVSCVSGAILDVVVDLRVGSPGYGRWASVPLNAETRCALFIEEGLGHAFITLSDEATVLYMCSTPYAPAREHGVHPLDPDLGIDWPGEGRPILSDKDAAAPSLAHARSAGLLPSYDACLDYVAGLSTGQARCSEGSQSPTGSTPAEPCRVWPSTL
jgi:dTDP-4-dehydrorhamnose 3,5-epimerase